MMKNTNLYNTSRKNPLPDEKDPTVRFGPNVFHCDSNLEQQYHLIPTTPHQSCNDNDSTRVAKIGVNYPIAHFSTILQKQHFIGEALRKIIRQLHNGQLRGPPLRFCSTSYKMTLAPRGPETTNSYSPTGNTTPSPTSHKLLSSRRKPNHGANKSNTNTSSRALCDRMTPNNHPACGRTYLQTPSGKKNCTLMGKPQLCKELLHR